MKILLVEPFFTGSHRQWAEGLVQHSRHEIEIHSLRGRHWKWRMYGGAVSLAEKVKGMTKPDLVLCTDMLDVATFQGLTKDVLQGVPVVVYFHENQLTYPWSPNDKDVDLSRDRHYAFTNFTTALAADQIWFNSEYHMTSFLGELPRFLAAFPDEKNLHLVDKLRDKSSVVPLGMDLQSFLAIARDKEPQRPVLLWNHRWEYDKRPEIFFEWCRMLKACGTDFGLVVCGEATGKYPSVFDEAEKEFKDHIVHWGYADSREAYVQCLSLANVLPVSGIQDFFGGSVVEALAAGCRPILPRRLAYPEHVPAELRDSCFYHEAKEVGDFILKPMDYDIGTVRSHQRRYDWSNLIDVYDDRLEKAAK